jgi:hypothetical protein
MARTKPVRGIRALTGLNVYELARLADCADPDEGRSRRRKRWSPGAVFLAAVRDDVVEAIRDGRITEADRDDSGQIHRIADEAPDYRTYRRWLEFADLAAWQEEPEVSGEWPCNLTDAAGIALYQIAERLCHALVDEWIGARA